MSETFRRIQTLVLGGDYLISDHGFDELAKDDILPTEIVDGLLTAIAIEDYPHRARGRSVLTLQQDLNGQPIHAVWAIPIGQHRPAILVTAYRPDPSMWDNEFKIRRVG